VTSSTRDLLQVALRAAMADRDALATSTLRNALAAIANAEAVQEWEPGATEVPRRVLTEADVDAVLRREVAELQGALDDCRRHGHAAGADELARRLSILAPHLNAGLA
jgi:uncharacterized protein YqeY